MTINNAKLTFLIPTIGRPSLKATIDSLLSQTCQEWCAIIVFDEIEPNFAISDGDDRIRIFRKPHSISTCEHRAGSVRNYGAQFVQTEWIAFVDDDDIIKPEYVEVFLSEIATYDNDAIIFRMIQLDDSKTHIQIHPNLNVDNFFPSSVGISFAVKKKIFDAGIAFRTGVEEDYFFLDAIRQNNYKMMISPNILYLVKHFNFEFSNYSITRVFINHATVVQRIEHRDA